MKMHTYPDRELLYMGLADALSSDLNTALSRAGRVSFAVPGGTTPAPAFDLICGLHLDWDRVDVVLTDERWVSEDDPRSNTRLVREHLLVERAAAARLLPLHAPSETPEESLSMLKGEVRAILPLNVLLLGMGEDMHTASLFPGGDKLATALSPNAPVLVAMRAPGAQEPRVTLTAPVLSGAMAKHLIITGEAKRAALETARGQLPEQAPIAAMLDGLNVHWAP